jgi:hypothetical protein
MDKPVRKLLTEPIVTPTATPKLDDPNESMTTRAAAAALLLIFFGLATPAGS